MTLHKPNMCNKENNKNGKFLKQQKIRFSKNNSNRLWTKLFSATGAGDNTCTDGPLDQISYPCLKFDPVILLRHRRQQLLYNDPAVF